MRTEPEIQARIAEMDAAMVAGDVTRTAALLLYTTRRTLLWVLGLPEDGE